MAYQEFTTGLTDTAIEFAQDIATSFPSPERPRSPPPELIEPCPCDGCYLVGACAVSGSECRAFRSYYTSRTGRWNQSDIGRFSEPSRAKRKELIERLNHR